MLVYRLLCACLLVSLCCLGAFMPGCGGRQPGVPPGGAAQPAAHALAALAPGDGFSVTVLQASLVGGATVERFNAELHAGASDSGMELIVSAQGARGLKALLLECSFDPARWKPEQAAGQGAFSTAADALCLSFSGRRGMVEAGAVLQCYDKRQGFSGSGPLLSLCFTRGVQDASRSTAAVPSSAADSAHLSWSAGQSQLHWEYRSTGDYDQNGYAGLTDLLPIALYYGDTAPGQSFPDSSARAVADGNLDGRINLADLTPLGANWGRSVLGGYSVYRSQHEADYPTDAGAPPDPALRLGTADFSSAGTAPGERKRFSFEVADPAQSDCYWVRPSDGVDEGSPSTMARYAPSAAGAWPMPYHDPQRTSCSQYVGPADPEVAWTYRPEGEAGYAGEAVIGPDGTVYSVCSGTLHAYYPNGELKWACEGVGQPVVGPDGSIYTGAGDRLVALDDIGRAKWQYQAGGGVRCAVGPEGTVYVTCGDSIFRAFRPDGTLKWSFDAGVGILPAPYVGPSGIVYLNSGAYIYAFTTEGDVRWELDILWATENAPVEAPDGTVYIANGLSLIGINPDGTARFQYRSMDGWIATYGPAVGADSTAYVESAGGVIYAISPSGALRWKYDTQVACEHAPVVDPLGFIWYWEDGILKRLRPDGTKYLQFPLENSITTYPVFDTQGRLYVGAPQLVALDYDRHILWTGTGNSSLDSGLVLAADGTVYLSATYAKQYPTPSVRKLVALSPQGQVKWGLETTNAANAPALNPDGSIILSSHAKDDDRLSCISAAGEMLWESEIPGTSVYQPVPAPGALYVPTYESLLVYDYAGNSTGSYVGRFNSAIALDSQNNCVLMSDTGLSKISAELQLVAQYNAYRLLGSCIGADGTIYGTQRGDSYQCVYVLALNPDCTERWRYEIPEASHNSSPVASVGLDGTTYCIYVEEEVINLPNGGKRWYNYDHILAVAANGQPRWTTERIDNIYSNVTVDAAGNSYVVCNDGVRSYDPAGQLRWHYLFFGANYYSGNPVIGADGTLYAVNTAGRLYALRDL